MLSVLFAVLCPRTCLFGQVEREDLHVRWSPASCLKMWRYLRLLLPATCITLDKTHSLSMECECIVDAACYTSGKEFLLGPLHVAGICIRDRPNYCVLGYACRVLRNVSIVLTLIGAGLYNCHVWLGCIGKCKMMSFDNQD